MEWEENDFYISNDKEKIFPLQKKSHDRKLFKGRSIFSSLYTGCSIVYVE